MADSARDAYVAGLTMLARRELSEAQVRQRLLRKGFEPDDVESAVARLKGERAIDDVRVADAIARTEVVIRRRGALRVDRRITSAGIAPATAKHAVDRAYADVDADALLEGALARRLRGHDGIEDQKTFQRLYRYLTGQGFESDRVLRLLRARATRAGTPDD